MKMLISKISWSVSLPWGAEGLAKEICKSVPVGGFNFLDCKGAIPGVSVNSNTSCVTLVKTFILRPSFFGDSTYSQGCYEDEIK